MALTLLFVLVALVATEQHDPGRQGGVRSGTPLPTAERTARPDQAFRVVPLQLAPTPLKSFQLSALAQRAPVLTKSSPAETQLHSSRTGVTCTIRIILVSPSMDPGILQKASDGQTPIDPIVQNEHSPCLE
jgi:hypothetical protein